MVACVRRLDEQGRAHEEVRTFGTMTGMLLALADWLLEAGVTHAAMESTGVYWKPVYHVLEGQIELLLVNAQAVTALTTERDAKTLELLLVTDITPYGLLIRRTKFQKTRLVPLHATAVTGLAHYLMHRQEARCGGDHVFVSDEGQPLVYWKVHSVFRALLKSAGIKPSGGRWPRIHELRHTLAVRALESSPTGRKRIGQHILALATYLGHVNINATYWYLETTPELLLDIAVVAENFVQGGRK